MKRRHVLESSLIGAVGIMRVLSWMGPDTDTGTDPELFTLSTLDERQTLNFSLAPDQRAYVLLSFSKSIRLAYVLRTRNDTAVNLRIISYDGSVTKPISEYTSYPELAQTQRSEVSASHPVSTGAGQFAILFTNPANDGPIQLGDNGTTAQIQYNVIASAA